MAALAQEARPLQDSRDSEASRLVRLATDPEARAQAGPTFCALLELYEDDIFGYALLILGDRTRADYAARDAFEEAIGEIHSSDLASEPGAFRRMLLAILLRVVAEARLERARMLPILLGALADPARGPAEPGDPRVEVERPELVARELREDLDPADVGRAPAPAWATDDDLIALYKCLPGPERRAYEFPIVRGLSPAETAAEMGLDVKSVIRLQRDALRSLRRWLAIVDNHRWRGDRA